VKPKGHEGQCWPALFTPLLPSPLGPTVATASGASLEGPLEGSRPGRLVPVRLVHIYTHAQGGDVAVRTWHLKLTVNNPSNDHFFVNWTPVQNCHRSNIQHWFQSFGGNPENLEDVQHFLVSLFHARKRDEKRLLFHHFTTAIDTDNIKKVFEDVRDTILHKNIETLMLQ